MHMGPFMILKIIAPDTYIVCVEIWREKGQIYGKDLKP